MNYTDHPPHRCEFDWCEQTSRHPEDGHSAEIGYTPATLSTLSTVDSSGASFPAVGVGVRFLREEPGVYVHISCDQPSIDVDVDLRPEEARRVVDAIGIALSLAQSAPNATEPPLST
ncbi:hypothetical protein R4227_16395 [Gordonia amicalis]|uniref:hypothetical protein n=1 Tax=Gordonia amicalis TaxID=89053 RepID=UPI002954729E|nr:hypothetical protein [Gordonia amicalis]MDV7101652.1 hypothetical protein [Gordonia amicalis]